eukprot:1158214-Pelagomonas_calceolata.AAC.5
MSLELTYVEKAAKHTADGPWSRCQGIGGSNHSAPVLDDLFAFPVTHLEIISVYDMREHPWTRAKQEMR